MSSLFDFDGPPDAYAVMGNPITHSKSPAIHAEFAKQTGQRLVYTAIQVDEGGLAQAIGNFQSNNGKGLNITVPFKREAWELVEERSDRAQSAGAVNTIVFKTDGTLFGDNTDGVGLVRDLTQNQGIDIKGKRILILGAGGAVRGVLGPVLNEKPDSIVIANRTVDKALKLAYEFKSDIRLQGSGFTGLEGRQFDIVINGTAASRDNEVPPIPAPILADDRCCYDMIDGVEQPAFFTWYRSHGDKKPRQ